MAPGLVRVALRRTLRDVRYVEAVRPRRARGLVRDVYRQLERDFGMLAPPVALHSAAPEALAAAWVLLRESLVAGGLTSRAEREVVASAVSAANACPYCVEVHGMALGALGEAGAAAAIGTGELAAITDPGTRALAAWSRGEGPLPPAVSRGAAAELAAVAVAFHYLNRVVSLFLGPSPLPDQVPAAAREPAKAVLGFFLKPGEPPVAGKSSALLPPAATDGPGWATPGGVLADAFARVAAAFEAAGERVLAPRVRDLVRRELKAWDGRPPGLGRAWATEAVAELPEAERAAGRFAVLVAKAAYQVDADVVAAVRREWSDDRALVEAASWVAFTAAAELGGRLPVRP
ncbi:carboxymuconolactone decarboxylase family protein [Amycolatopsis sp. OK19-0408]|uniref:Carboxymuconolactone decarboxylase family protein n=1 Tax=Amycolatopsis iheyensis TaxID=2945988 RepID=A0A9X2NAB1_9PSEU|nr:carboxymuconolactone decarboxylase family protein [Amycolatopsis iheyensis]MCR6483527.1 carboxymuconolactone decarboxylase family protein [Amycolatopsis iheyensis]